MAPTLAASLRPSLAPVAAASSRLASVRGISTAMVPAVTGCSRSGTTSFAITKEIGAVMATAVSRCSIATLPMVT